MNAVIVSDGRLYSRMLELELLEMGWGCRSFIAEGCAAERKSLIAAEVAEYAREIACENFIVNAENTANADFFAGFLGSGIVLPERRVFLLGRPSVVESIGDRLGAEIRGNINIYEKPLLIGGFLNDLKKRRENSAVSKTIIKNDGFIIDESARTVAYNGVPVELTKKEFELFLRLAKSSGVPVRREDLFLSVWGGESAENPGIVEVYIKYLREKIDRKFNMKTIFTIRGIGYMVKS